MNLYCRFPDGLVNIYDPLEREVVGLSLTGIGSASKITRLAHENVSGDIDRRDVAHSMACSLSPVRLY